MKRKGTPKRKPTIRKPSTRTKLPFTTVEQRKAQRLEGMRQRFIALTGKAILLLPEDDQAEIQRYANEIGAVK